MARAGLGMRVLTSLVALALMLFSVGFAFAVVQDYADRGICPDGASVQGVPVGGLSRAEAVARVGSVVDERLMRPLTVEFRGRRFTFDAASAVSLDVEGMVEETFAPRRGSTMTSRVYARLVGERTGADVSRQPSVDAAKVNAWTAQVAHSIALAPVDATVSVVGHAVHVAPERVGYVLDTPAARTTVTLALRNGRRDAKLPVRTLKPKVTRRDIGRTIVVKRSARHLWLYDGEKLEKDYPIAVGQPEWPTPLGKWRVVDKQYMPTWTNPHSSWSAGMPDTIGPGYSNPLGTRALALDAAGVLIHGSANDASIGTPASHGCMRMHMSDIEDLFERVDQGTPVFIVP